MSTREVLWAALVVTPGRTAHELARTVLGKTGPTSASVQSGSCLMLLQRMEADGQVTRQQVRRPGQGKPVSEWHAVPGVFAVAETGGRHEHRYQGQTLNHAHEGGEQRHGYFEHPEDPPPRLPLHLRRLDQVEARIVELGGRTARDGQLASLLSALRDELVAAQ